MKFDDLGTRCRYLLDRPETVESAVLTAASMIPTKFYREWEDNSPPWIAARAALLLGVPFYAGQHNHDRSPISLVREAIERHYGAQCAAAAAQLQDEQRAALLTAEANWRRAETRRRRQAMADHAALPPMTLRRLAGGMDRFRRSWSRDELVMVLDGARIRPTAEAVEALRGELDFLRQQRDRRRAQRRNYRRQPERSGRRLPAGTPAERLAALRRVSIERAARAIMPFGAALGDDVTLEFGAPSYRIVTRQETRRYGRRSPVRFGRVTGAEHRISVPADWRVSVERRGLGLVAGALTLAAAPRPAPEGIEAVDAVVARPGRGYFAIVERRVYARVAGGAWLHVEAADLSPTAARISRCGNAERRRLMLAIYGLGRWLADIGARAVHEDAYGRLYRVERGQLEPIVAVAVRDATDPSREYVLRVAPHCRTAHEAVAWTFGLSAEQYAPIVET